MVGSVATKPWSSFRGPIYPSKCLHRFGCRLGTGFLGRAQFYNALKLVTVAQSGRELTPDIVRAALFGPAASQIPAPQIAAPTAVPPSPVLPPAGIRGPTVQPGVASGQQYVPPANNQFLRPVSLQTIPTPTPLQAASMGIPGVGTTGQRPQIPSGSAKWPGSRIARANSAGPISNVSAGQGVQIRGSTPVPLKQDGLGQASSAFQGGPIPSVLSKPVQDNIRSSFSTGLGDIKGISADGNGFSLDSIFGGDVFSATTSQSKQIVASQPLYSGNNVSSSTALVPTPAAPGPSLAKQNQLDKPQSTSIVPVSIGVGATASSLGGNTQLSWPRMTQSNAQKYTKVFSEVDTGRDGKITGEQACDLFLSWRLPREVLKQVWDLSDQDGDSMLSLREFCIALYFMEQYREGRPLPPVLPAGIQIDEALKSGAEAQTATQLSVAVSGMPWQHNPVNVSRPGIHGAVPVNMPGQFQTPRSEGVNTEQPVQQKSRVPVLELNFVNQLSRDEQNTLKSKQKDAEEAEKKGVKVFRNLYNGGQKQK